jgi:pimeloyl-ACP methyl ester carboxylesterase
MPILQMPDGRGLEVVVSGPDQGTAVVFHHGTPGCAIPFGPFVDEFAARGLRLVTYSRAGYGGSDRLAGRSVADIAADMRSVLDQLEIDRSYTMGWSGGGPHVLATAALLPERVIAAVSLAGVAPYEAPGLEWMSGMGAENIAEFGAAVEGSEALEAFLSKEGQWVRRVTADEVIEGFGDLVSDADKRVLTGEFAEWTAAGLRDSQRNGIWGWFDDDLAFVKPWGFDIGAISRPVAVWQGDQDRMVPVNHGPWLAAHVGSAHPRLRPGEGHLSLTIGHMSDILDDMLALAS